MKPFDVKAAQAAEAELERAMVARFGPDYLIRKLDALLKRPRPAPPRRSVRRGESE